MNVYLFTKCSKVERVSIRLPVEGDGEHMMMARNPQIANDDFDDSHMRARGWGDIESTMYDQIESCIDAILAAREEAAARREALHAARRRVLCRAKTRKGAPCRLKSEPGKRRCKFHGGKSTGARTPEGIERIREAQHRRWAKWRADRDAGAA